MDIRARAGTVSYRVGLATVLGPPLTRLLAGSWRWTLPDGSPEACGGAIPGESDDHFPLRHAIYALWHAQLLPLALRHRDQGAAVLVSRHRDGEVTARVLSRLGYHLVRGSSTRGGSAGLREMIRAGKAGRALAFTPDGPRGPAGRCQPGVVRAAAATGLPIVPAAAAAVSGKRVSSWDRFLVPLPGSRIVVAYGAPLRVPADSDRSELESARRELERRLEALTRCCEEGAARLRTGPS